MQDLLSTVAFGSFNLQRRKQAEIRMRRALNRLQSFANSAVLFVQELGRGTPHVPKHRLVAVSDSREVGILIPKKLQHHYVRESAVVLYLYGCWTGRNDVQLAL